MSLTLTLPSVIGPNSGVFADGILRGQIGVANPDKVIYRSLSYTSGKYYTIDYASGIESTTDVTAQTSVQLFPTSGSGNLSVNDAFEFAVTKAEFDAGRRIKGIHIDVTTISQNLTFNVVYFATNDTWKTATNIVGLSTVLTTTGDNHVHFDVPSDWASITHTDGTTVTRVYPFRIVITAVGASPVAPVATLRFVELQTPSQIDITTGVTDYGIDLPNPHVIEGDTIDTITTIKQAGLEGTIWKAQVGGVNAYQYFNGSAFVTLNVNNGVITNQNNASYTPVNLTASAANAVAATTLAFEDGGYVEFTLPSASAGAGGGLRSVDGNTTWLIGISGGQVVVIENNVIKYTHATAPVANTVFRVWFVKDGDVRYYVGDANVYTSTVKPTQGLQGYFTAAANATQVQSIKLVRFNVESAVPLSAAMGTLTNFAAANGVTVTGEFPKTLKITWSPPADWVAHTTANSPNGIAGYHMRVVKTGTVLSGDRLSHVRSLFMDGTRATGLDLGTAHNFTRVGVKFHSYQEFTQNIQLELINLDTQVSATVTLVPESDQLGEADDVLSQPISFSSGQRLMLRELSGRANQYIGSGDAVLS